MSDLVERLRAALDEAEKLAQAIPEGERDWLPSATWFTDMLHPMQSQLRERPGWLPVITEEDIAHIARWDPDTVLRLVERDRALLARYEAVIDIELAWAQVEILHGEVERAAEFWLGDNP
jgi:hypothetical protein